MKSRSREESIALFWDKVRKATGCWLWEGSMNGQGYGNFRSRFFPGQILSHRIAWMIAHACDVPNSLHVIHKCDVPLCVRPSHLRLGTHAENMADMARKGRHSTKKSTDHIPRGKDHHYYKRGPKMTREQALMIRASTECNVDLANRFGVTPTMISHIKHGRTWK